MKFNDTAIAAESMGLYYACSPNEVCILRVFGDLDIMNAGAKSQDDLHRPANP
jgi:hypothetical protein